LRSQFKIGTTTGLVARTCTTIIIIVVVIVIIIINRSVAHSMEASLEIGESSIGRATMECIILLVESESQCSASASVIL